MADEKPLESRILDWLLQEGYPLEFKTANIFRENGFATYQGHYVDDTKSGRRREIDVEADCNLEIDGSIIRTSFMVECKGSKDKPWVIFTDRNSQISPGACIAQSICTKTVESIFWYLADDLTLHGLELFDTPLRPGFNGRQAFINQHDVVYATLQSVVSACYAKKQYYERGLRYDSLSMGVLLIPIVVIDGRLFESYYDERAAEVRVEERKKIRLHWRGSDVWHLHSTMDIVTIDFLPEYVRRLYRETKLLMQKMIPFYKVLDRCLVQASLDPLQEIPKASKALENLPPLLRHLVK